MSDFSSLDLKSYSDMRDGIFNSIVAPNMRAEVEDLFAARHRWRTFGSWAEGCAQLMLGVSTILIFVSGFFNSRVWAFSAGCANAVCLALFRFSSYAESESAERNAILARQLTVLGISPVPAINADPPSREDGLPRGGSRNSLPRDVAGPRDELAFDGIRAALTRDALDMLARDAGRPGLDRKTSAKHSE